MKNEFETDATSEQEFKNATQRFHNEVVPLIKEVIDRQNANDGPVLFSLSGLIGNMIRVMNNGNPADMMRDILAAMNVMARHCHLDINIGIGLPDGATAREEQAAHELSEKMGAPVIVGGSLKDMPLTPEQKRKLN